MHSERGECGEVVPVIYPGLTLPMAVHAPGDFISDALRAKGWWSQRDFKLYNALLKPGDFFVDVGAHIGLYTLYAAHKVGGQGKVIAIEPEPKNFELLLNNIRLSNFPQIEPINAAVGVEEGRGNLYMSPTNSGDHYLSSGVPDEVREQKSVRVTTIDRILMRFDKGPKLVKMDIQGTEMSALAGMKKTLAAHQPLLLIEFAPGLMLRAGDSPFEFFAFIEKNKYLPYRILDDFHTGPLLEVVTVQSLLEFTQQQRTSDVGWDLLLVPQEKHTALVPLLRAL